MAAGQNVSYAEQIIPPRATFDASILIVCDDAFISRIYSTRLCSSGFSQPSTAKNAKNAFLFFESHRCDLVVLDASLGSSPDESFDFLELIRSRGFHGTVIMMAKAPTLETLYRAAATGANDFGLRGQKLDIAGEVRRLLQRRSWVDQTAWCPDAVRRTGFFRSVGMTKGEIEILTEFARDFPRQSDLAKRMEKTAAYIRKTFSRIYEKLDDPLSVNNPAQLSHLLTICTLYG